MRVNKLTAGKNMMWESSRMMLPEHKEAILKQNKSVNKKVKPILDEQRIEELVRTIAVAVFAEQTVKIQLFDEYEYIYLYGKIDKIQPESKQLKIRADDSYEWVKLDDVMEIELIK